MDTTAIAAILGIAEKLLPYIAGNSPKITEIVDDLEVAVPALVKVGGVVMQRTKNIIAVLQADDAITDEAWDKCEAMNKASDAAFDAADKPQPGDPARETE